jgi:GR25 family glycosyltransferase involved in LPS biosynthesis
MSIYFFILNMDKNPERYQNISNQLNNLNCNYSRIRSIDGFNMDNDDDVKILLSPRKELIGNLFQSVETKRKWIYDGTIFKSFPNLNLYGHYGTKGLTLSNIKAFIQASKLNYDWYCILEDDSEIDKTSYDSIISFITNKNNENIDIVLLDARHNGWGGTAGMLYNKNIIFKLIEDLHPLSNFSITSTKYGDKNLGNLWDWKLWKYVIFINKNFKILPCIKSGNFKSTINI